MLYDQAGLALAYLDANLFTGKRVYERVARGILDYVIRDLSHPDGGFFCAEDADSEGEEGRFYVWSESEIREVLGSDTSPRFIDAYGVRPEGNWEGANILHASAIDPLIDRSLDDARRLLLERRAARTRPHRDEKVVAAWNGFMIEAMARTGWAFDEPRYVDAALRAATFVDEHLWRGGRLHRHFRDGAADVRAYLDDYAFLSRAFLALYEVTFDTRHLVRAGDLVRAMIELFSLESGAFQLQGADAERLLVPVIEIYDGAIPSGNAVAASVLLRLGHLTGNRSLEERGERVLRVFAETAVRSPSSFAELLSALDFATGPITEVVYAGSGHDPVVRAMREVARRRYTPNLVQVFHPIEDAETARNLIPYLAAQPAIGGGATAYLCRNYACEQPVRDVEALARLLSVGTSRNP
jgi:uncharacterized protein YyaL (SSP411 family)